MQGIGSPVGGPIASDSLPWEPGGSGWMPQAPPGAPTLWLKETGISGSPIDSIANAGSAAGSISAAAGARASVATVAGKSAASYNGTANVEGGGPLVSAVATASAWTVACAFKLTALGSGTNGYDMPAILMDGDGAAGGNWYPLVVDATGIRSGQYDAGAADRKTAAIAVSTGVVYVAVAYFDGSTISLTVNGSTQTAASGNIGTLIKAVRQGANYLSAAWLNGTICETVAYNTALSAGDRGVLSLYLRGRWGGV